MGDQRPDVPLIHQPFQTVENTVVPGVRRHFHHQDAALADAQGRKMLFFHAPELVEIVDLRSHDPGGQRGAALRLLSHSLLQAKQRGIPPFEEPAGGFGLGIKMGRQHCGGHPLAGKGLQHRNRFLQITATVVQSGENVRVPISHGCRNRSFFHNSSCISHSDRCPLREKLCR